MRKLDQLTVATLCLLASLFFVGTVSADDAISPSSDEYSAEQIEFFESHIRPLLVEHCYECHSAEAAILRGGLRLDYRDGWLTGGDSGPALIPGSPADSVLLQAIRYESLEMPPDGKLPDESIALIEQWITMGAPAPASEGSAASTARVIDMEREREFWSFQPIVSHSPPDVNHTDWPAGDIDRFLLHAMDSADLSPATDADRRTLIRRVYFDLIGLPPSPEEIAAFIDDPRDDMAAFADVVDTLLASRHFGEHWGRHWLDVARYADSTGGGRSMLYGTSWQYRDYVIESFNANTPFNTFIVEQLAGDLLPFDDYQQGSRQAVATGFLALGPTNYEEQDKTQLEYDVIDEQLDTLGRAFLGMTIGCARCHDHKFDPIPTADYYALAGIFRSTTTLEHDNVSIWVKRSLPVPPEVQQHLEEHRAQVAALERELETSRQELAQLRSRIPILALDEESTSGVTRRGEWQESQSIPGFVGTRYLYANGVASAAGDVEVPEIDYAFQVPQSGPYEVRVSYTPHENRSTDTLIVVQHATGSDERRIDQQQPAPIEGAFVSLGMFEFSSEATAVVTVSTRGATGVVIADSVQLIPQFASTVGSSSAGRIVSDPATLPGVVLDNVDAVKTGAWVDSVYYKSYVGAGYIHDDNAAKGERSIIFHTDLPAGGMYEVRMSYTPGESRAPNVPVILQTADGERIVTVDQRQVPDIDGLFTSLGTFRFTNDQFAEVTISNEGTSGHVIVDAIQFLLIEDAPPAATLADSQQTATVEADEVDLSAILDRIETLESSVSQREAALAALEESAPPVPPTVLSVREADAIADCAICIRGNPHNQGDVVPRGVLSVINTVDGISLPNDASGRLELAQWIAHPAHPLTARVYVNRIWQHLFGVGIVRSVDNFGTTGELPSHPDLLDHLASRFVDNGWSTKRLIREIVLSRAYRLGGQPTDKQLATDPENRLQSWHSRRRMDAEEIYDAMLSLSGELDLTQGGDTVREGTDSEYGYQFDVGRRAAYLPVFRNRMPDLFSVFDFPDPNQSIGRRNVSTLSTQALFLMNSPFIRERAQAAASRLIAEMDDSGQRIELLYQRGLGRPPTFAERDQIVRFLISDVLAAREELDSWTDVCQAIMCSVDFRYVH